MIQDDAGGVRYVIGTGIDSTERTRLERAIVEVSEEERSRIGHQLHEHLCNHLAGTALIAGALAEEARKGNDIDPDALDGVSHLVAEAVDQASALARGLVPVRIEKDGLLAALQEMTVDVLRRTSIECEFTAETMYPELAHTSMANHLSRISPGSFGERAGPPAIHANHDRRDLSRRQPFPRSPRQRTTAGGWTVAGWTPGCT